MERHFNDTDEEEESRNKLSNVEFELLKNDRFEK